jgi:hypothetical protein
MCDWNFIVKHQAEHIDRERVGSNSDPVRKPSSFLYTVPLAARRHLTAMLERLPHQRVGSRARGLS